MNFICLDLEWNQTYAERAQAVQKRLSCRLRGEVIQIGAVKMDEELNFIGSFSLIVRPRFFGKLQKHVSRLTGISQECVDLGAPLPEAAEQFRRFCGEDFAFLTWGPDDIPMLKENMNAHRISTDWLDKVYDLQLIFSRQTQESRCQKSLEFAMDYYAIEQHLPAHDALNDAYFTALVAKKLDMKRGISEYSDQPKDCLELRVYGDADAGEHGFASIDDLLKCQPIGAPLCPVCGQPLQMDTDILHTRGQRYTRLLHCEKDGAMILRVKPMRNYNGTYRGRATISLSTEEESTAFLQKMQEHKSALSRRRRVRTRRKPAGTEQTHTADMPEAVSAE